MAAARAGDRGALDALLRRHANRLHTVCRRILADDADAADATQEALVAIVSHLDRFDGRSAFATWAYRIATNACLDELRRQRRRPRPVEDSALEPGAGAPPWGTAVGGSSPGDGTAALEAVSDRIDIDAALLRLSPEYRAAVVLRDLVGLDYAEIGDVLGLPPGTVRSRIARGRAALATALGNPPAASERPSRRT